ncbi:unnamed protein product [Dracunculus medinensis]|uniref:Apple domain-containing protein n=1 Tax=Dracunculus medinensis TaxID=318479 RepID=A0A158Q4C2_DRAME|nr:unnamed protein product [Dracunculus medinensis]
MADNFTIMFLAVITKITMYLRAVATLSFIFEIIVAEQFCALTPVLHNVNKHQSLGSTYRKFLHEEKDCKKKCELDATFNCTAILWAAATTGECYLMDKVDLTNDIYRDDQHYTLFVMKCDGQDLPEIGFSLFLKAQENVSQPHGYGYRSPGLISEKACREFCAANYEGVKCSAYAIGNKPISQCFLYSEYPHSTGNGSMTIYRKVCRRSPHNCQYTVWSEWTVCSATCDGGQQSRKREILAKPSKNGIPCLEIEKIQTRRCGEVPCPGCTYGPWSQFSACSASCGKGTMTRTRNIIGPSGHHANQTACYHEQETLKEISEPTHCRHYYGPVSIQLNCERDDCEFEDEALTTTTSHSAISFIADELTTDEPFAQGINQWTPRIETTQIDEFVVAEAASIEILPSENTPCFLHGFIDRKIFLSEGSKYYLYDHQCRANKTKDTAICEWQSVATEIDLSTYPNKEPLGHIRSSQRCGTVCQLTYPTFVLKKICTAYAYTFNLTTNPDLDNCFMIDHQRFKSDDELDKLLVHGSGTYNVYFLSCS